MLPNTNSTGATGGHPNKDDDTLRRPGRWAIPGFRWWILGLLFFGTALSFFDRQVLSVLAPTVKAEMGMTNSQLANVMAAFTLSYSIMFVLGGRFLDWVGTRCGMLICVSLWTIASAAHAGVRSAWQLGACRFLLGVGEGGCFPGVTKAALEWFPLRQRSRAIGFAIGGRRSARWRRRRWRPGWWGTWVGEAPSGPRARSGPCGCCCGPCSIGGRSNRRSCRLRNWR